MSRTCRSASLYRHDQATAVGLDGKVEEARGFIEMGIIGGDEIDLQATLPTCPYCLDRELMG